MTGVTVDRSFPLADWISNAAQIGIASAAALDNSISPGLVRQRTSLSLRLSQSKTRRSVVGVEIAGVATTLAHEARYGTVQSQGSKISVEIMAVPRPLNSSLAQGAPALPRQP